MKEFIHSRRCETMETALQIIHTWASYYHDNFWTFQDKHHMANLKDIKKKCDEVLDGKKKTEHAKKCC